MNTPIRRGIPCVACLVLLLGITAPQAGNTGALRVTIAAADGAALTGARVTLTDPGSSSFHMEAVSDARGRVDLLGLSPREYRFLVEKEGYQSYESNFLARAGETADRKVTLEKIPAAAASGAAEKPPAWVASYNEAVAAFQRNDDDAALSRLDVSLGGKGDFAPALALKGIVLEKRGHCEEAAPMLKRAWQIDPAQTAALAPLIRCLQAAGRADEAETYRKLQAQAGRTAADLYNEAVQRINAGDDAAAAPLLQQALEQDAGFAPAQYQYGLILFRRGDVAGAAARLELYLKIAPGGEFAADAKALLAAIKP